MPKDHGVRKLARALDVNEAAVRKWIARPDWPFGSRGPFDISEVRAWRALAVEPRNEAEVIVGGDALNGISPERRARVAVSIERALKLRLERKALEGTLHDVAECRQRRIAQIHRVKSGLYGMARNLPPSLAGKTVEQIEAAMVTAIEKLLTDFSEP